MIYIFQTEKWYHAYVKSDLSLTAAMTILGSSSSWSTIYMTYITGSIQYEWKKMQPSIQCKSMEEMQEVVYGNWQKKTGWTVEWKYVRVREVLRDKINIVWVEFKQDVKCIRCVQSFSPGLQMLVYREECSNVRALQSQIIVPFLSFHFPRLEWDVAKEQLFVGREKKDPNIVGF